MLWWHDWSAAHRNATSSPDEVQGNTDTSEGRKMAGMRNLEQARSLGTYVKVTLLAWLSMIGFDFFLHAGVLAHLYLEPDPFLVPPERACALIPVGYLSFLSLAILLTWLMARLSIQGWHQGGILGLQLGALAQGAFTLGLLSISTARPALLAGWFFGQTVELGIAGMVVGSAFAAPRLGRLFVKVLVLVIGAFAFAVLLQNVGLASAVSR